MCPNISVEFTCIATEVAFFDWYRNGMEIEDFNSGDPIGMIVVAPYTLFLDIVRRFSSNVLANFKSRLVVNLSDLMSGDNISCSSLPILKSEILNYKLRGNKGPMCMCIYFTCIGRTEGAFVLWGGQKEHVCIMIFELEFSDCCIMWSFHNIFRIV